MQTAETQGTAGPCDEISLGVGGHGTLFCNCGVKCFETEAIQPSRRRFNIISMGQESLN